MYTDYKKEVFNSLNIAFTANREAHMQKNRTMELYNINFMLSGNPSKDSSIKKEDLYKKKIKYLRKALRLIEEYNVDIEYGLRDGILFFRDNGIMLIFHVFDIKTKHTNMQWDGKKNKDFPFNLK